MESSKEAKEAKVCSCVLHTLMKHHFRVKSLDEKKSIVTVGRPTPDMLKFKTKSSQNKETIFFKKEYYKRFSWLTGCDNSNRLFCWLCILLSFEKEKWSSGGFTDLNNLVTECTRHGRSEAHIRACNEMKEFQTSNHLTVIKEEEIEDNEEDILSSNEIDLCTDESAEDNSVAWSIAESHSEKKIPPKNKPRKRSAPPELELLDKVVNKLRKITDKEEENEFDVYCKSLAIQLKKMPLERALLCQQRIHNSMTSERLEFIKCGKVQDQTVSKGTYAFSCTGCRKVHYIDKKNLK